MSLIKTADLDPEKNYIFCYHPHGVISLGAIANFTTESTGFSRLFPGISLLPSLATQQTHTRTHMPLLEAELTCPSYSGIDLRVLTLRLNFLCPIYRELVLAFGLCDVSEKSCHNNLTRGTGASILIVVGGAQEVTICFMNLCEGEAESYKKIHSKRTDERLRQMQLLTLLLM